MRNAYEQTDGECFQNRFYLHTRMEHGINRVPWKEPTHASNASDWRSHRKLMRSPDALLSKSDYSASEILYPKFHLYENNNSSRIDIPFKVFVGRIFIGISVAEQSVNAESVPFVPLYERAFVGIFDERSNVKSIPT